MKCLNIEIGPISILLKFIIIMPPGNENNSSCGLETVAGFPVEKKMFAQYKARAILICQ